MLLPKRRSSSSSSSRRTPSGRDRLPPPTTTGTTNRWHSSTSPAPKAWAARSAPPTARSRPTDPFLRRPASGSKSRSTRVVARRPPALPGPHGLGGARGAAHGKVAPHRPFHPPHRLGVEVPLDPRLGGRHCLQRLGVHDLVGRLPNLQIGGA